MSDFQVTSGDIRLRVNGLSKVARDLKKAGADMQSMSDLMHRIGNIVVGGAQIPQLTGTLAETLRAGRGKTKAVVRLGGARARYAGVRNYGWPARNIEPMQPSLEDTVAAYRPEILSALDAGLTDILRENDL